MPVSSKEPTPIRPWPNVLSWVVMIGRRHVVEVDLDQPVVDLADDPDVVPVVGPGSALGPLLGDRDAGLVVDEEDAVGVGVGLLAQVDVIEVAWVLVAEEQADVAMAVVAARRADLQGHDEVADVDVRGQGDVERRADLRLVLARPCAVRARGRRRELGEPPGVVVGEGPPAE